MEIDALMNKASFVRTTLIFSTSGKKKNKVQRVKKVTGSLQDHMRKYNVVVELASSPKGMKSGQLFPGEKSFPGKRMKL